VAGGASPGGEGLPPLGELGAGAEALAQRLDAAVGDVEGVRAVSVETGIEVCAGDNPRSDRRLEAEQARLHLGRFDAGGVAGDQQVGHAGRPLELRHRQLL
jgi:hypothetical protein